jgi:hypothetical protein
MGSVSIEVSPMTTGQPAMTGSYDYFLVALSVVIAILASYTALDLAGRVTAASGWLRQSWLAGGAAAMGFGIWSMHYIGMLAFRLPVPVAYDWPTVMFSLGAAIVASALALHTVSRKAMGPLQAVLGSLATKVQETLVPKGLVWHRGTVETHYQPARSIGGDFGLVILGGDCLTAMVCDVSGHGIGSALVANRVYTEIIDLIQRGTEFAPMLQRLNRFVLQSFSGQFYFTLAAVRLNGDGRTLVFAGAGHPPTMIARPGEQPRLLESQSCALGLLEEAVNGNATTQVQLQAGDRVVMYTDGFSECFNLQEQELGIDGLSRIVGEASEQPMPEMKRAILDSIDAWQNGPPADDRSLIVVGVR